MLTKRIIPCLDVKDGRVVKGVQFVDLRDAGDPVEVAAAYDAQGADELCFLDINASHEGRGTMLDLVARTADRVMIPFSVGGGVSSVEDVRALLQAGADKVTINTAAVQRPELIQEVAERLGSANLVVAIDARRRDPERAEAGWEVFTHGGRRPTDLDALEWVRQAERLGAGLVRSRPGCWRKSRPGGWKIPSSSFPKPTSRRSRWPMTSSLCPAGGNGPVWASCSASP